MNSARAVAALAALLTAACSSPANGDGDGDGERDAAPGSDASDPNAVDYDFLFDDSRVVDVHLTFEATAWAALEADNETYVSATFDYGGEVVANVGVRHKGNVSLQFGNNKKSFKVKFSEFAPGARFRGIKRMNFHNGFKDPTIIRETLAYPLTQAAGGHASRTSHVKIFVTVPGMHDREFWGLYTNIEQVDKTFLRDRFADPEGNLYKGGRYNYQGPDVNLYVPAPFEPKTNEQSDHSRVVEFLDILNNAPDATFAAEIQTVFEVDPFLSWLAANTMLANMDNVTNGGGSNGYVYLDPSTNKFVYIAWDMNEAFGSTSEGLSVNELLNLDIDMPVVNPAAPSPLVGRILAVPEFLTSYRSKVAALVAGPFSEAVLFARIDELRTLTRPFALADTRKDYSAADYDLSFDVDVAGLPNPPYPNGNMVIGLRRFITARLQSVTAQLGN